VTAASGEESDAAVLSSPYDRGMSLRTSLAVAASAAVLSVALVGCAAPVASPLQTPTPTPTPAVEESGALEISVAPATGEVFTGSGYQVTAPEGWSAPADAADRADIFLISGEEHADGFIDTLNVLLGQASTDSLEEYEAGSVSYLEIVKGATDVEVRPRVLLDDSVAVHISALFHHSSGVQYWTEQYIVNAADIGYTITFSFSESVPVGDREALAESMLATWTWG
jgi:hypothetical protein